MPEIDITINENDKDLIIEALKNYHKELGRKVENSVSDGNIRKHQSKMQKIRGLAAKKFDLGYEEVNQWE